MCNAKEFISSMKEDSMWAGGGDCDICGGIMNDEDNGGGYYVGDGLSSCWECMWMMYGKATSKKEESTK